MEAALEALAGSPLAGWLRASRWGYATVNTMHVLGIALLVGSILPLDLRLLGLWRTVPLTALARTLIPVAVSGLLLAITTGTLLFITRATEYAALDLFFVKMGLVAAGIGHALAVQLGPGIQRLSPSGRRLAGATSLTIWLSALVCGRFLAFVAD